MQKLYRPLGYCASVACVVNDIYWKPIDKQKQMSRSEQDSPYVAYRQMEKSEKFSN